jgi:hypothetical protein
MSLSTAEQRSLSCIADGLAASDPKLASLLKVFNRVVSDEEMPARQPRVRNQQQGSSSSHQARRRTGKRRHWYGNGKAEWIALTIGILLGTALIATTIVLSFSHPGDNGRRQCTQSRSAGQLFSSVSCHESPGAVTPDP